MGHDIEVALLTLGSTLLLTMIIWLSARMARVWKTPKRVDRLEAVQPHIMNVLDVVIEVLALDIRALQGHKINGELSEAQRKMAETREEYRKFINEAVVSKK